MNTNTRTLKVIALWVLILVTAVLLYNIVGHAQAPARGQAPTAAAPATAQTPAGAQAPVPAAGAGRGGGRGGEAAVNVPPPTSPVTGNAVLGKTLYYNYNCYGCHGYNGETGRAFVGRWGNLATEAGFIAFLRLRADQHPNNPATNMPNFPVSTMSDKQAKDIYAYIRTFTSHTPEVKDSPTLNAIVASANRPYKK